MKTILILITLFPALFGAYRPIAKSQKKVYVLSIAENKITKARDTTVFWGKQHYNYVTMPVKLLNPYNDALVYFTMTCSTLEIFTTNNKNVEIERLPCQYNTPITVTILPHQSSFINIRFFFTKNFGNNSRRFKVGMYLCKRSEMNGSDFFNYLVHSSWPKNLLIWSNEVIIER